VRLRGGTAPRDTAGLAVLRGRMTAMAPALDAMSGTSVSKRTSGEMCLPNLRGDVGIAALRKRGWEAEHGSRQRVTGSGSIIHGKSTRSARRARRRSRPAGTR
jgi:hypothetical protein